MTTAELVGSLSDALRRAVEIPDFEAAGPAALIGLEHEYRLFEAERAIDFRDLIHRLDVPGRRLDPGDANAYRLPSGLALTCDDAEAEIATPPLSTGAGFTSEITAWATTGRTTLESLLPAGVKSDGYSTHLSVSIAQPDAPAVIDLFCRTFAPSLMLVFETEASFGIYLRPRSGRVELCGDYVAGGYLQATAAFFTGGVRACAAALASRGPLHPGLPPSLDVSLRPAVGRYGWYAGRRSAFGFDLYEAGRRAVLPRATAGTIAADEQFRLSWQAARSRLNHGTHEAGMELMDAIARGDLPLRVESKQDIESREPPAPSAPHPLAGATRLWQRPGFELRAVWATWDFTVFKIESRTSPATAFTSIPRAAFGRFQDRLDGGELDGILTAYLASPRHGRRLLTGDNALEAGLWDEIGPAEALLAPEYDPATGKLTDSETIVAKRPGAARSKPRPLKALFLPLDLTTQPPVPPAPEAGETPVPPPLPTPLPGEGSGASHLPARPLLVLGAIAVAAIVTVASVVSGVFGDSPAAVPPDATSTSTPSATATQTLTSTPPPSATPPVVAPPLPTQAANATPLPPSPTVAPAASTPTAAATSTPPPTSTPSPTATATRTATPSVTATRVLDPTITPTPGCGALGAICTPTPPANCGALICTPTPQP